jgi:hypothetical protein
MEEIWQGRGEGEKKEEKRGLEMDSWSGPLLYVFDFQAESGLRKEHSGSKWYGGGASVMKGS